MICKFSHLNIHKNKTNHRMLIICLKIAMLGTKMLYRFVFTMRRCLFLLILLCFQPLNIKEQFQKAIIIYSGTVNDVIYGIQPNIKNLNKEDIPTYNIYEI